MLVIVPRGAARGVEGRRATSEQALDQRLAQHRVGAKPAGNEFAGAPSMEASLRTREQLRRERIDQRPEAAIPQQPWHRDCVESPAGPRGRLDEPPQLIEPEPP